VLAAYSRWNGAKGGAHQGDPHEPDWIYCDEPTAGLDPVAAADMRHYLGEQARRGAALIVTTHVLGEGELMADRIAHAPRRHRHDGTLDELRRKSAAGRRFTAQLAAETVESRAARSVVA